MAVSTFAAFACSHLQQSDSEYIVKRLVKQGNMLKFVKRGGTTSLICPSQIRAYKLSLIVFGDATRPSNAGQLDIVRVLLIGQPEKGSAFHPLVWSSY